MSASSLSLHVTPGSKHHDHAWADPNNCYGYILPSQAISPWVAILGTGWRFARSQWNKPVEAHYHDELQVTLGLDLLIAGSVDNAFGIEKFAAKQLQPSGRRLSASPRFGAEAEVWPGWVRFRGGTYWEPARYVGISGRIHATVGGEFRIYEFHIGKSPYRLALSLSGDFSTHYKNAGASLGFWD